MTSTIIRVKRHCDEEPQDTLILNCKRRKLDEAGDNNEGATADDAVHAVLQFAGTVNSQDEVLNTLNERGSLKSTTEAQFKSQPTDLPKIRERIRAEFHANIKENRYKVVNFSRPNVQEANDITIVDVEPKAEDKTSKSSNYVYDLYYTTSDDLVQIYDEDLVGVYPVSAELVYGSHRDNGVLDSDNESEDSNAENNWRNDYPDEDELKDDDSIDENDMLHAMNSVKLEDDPLSSDEEVQGFSYSIDSEAAGFEEDVDESDVNRYGEQYARFKAKYSRQDKDNTIDDTENYYDPDYEADGTW